VKSAENKITYTKQFKRITPRQRRHFDGHNPLVVLTDCRQKNL